MLRLMRTGPDPLRALCTGITPIIPPIQISISDSFSSDSVTDSIDIIDSLRILSDMFDFYDEVEGRRVIAVSGRRMSDHGPR